MKNLFILLLLAIIVNTPLITKSQGCSGSSTEDGVNIIGYVQTEYQYQFWGDSIDASYNGLKSQSSFYFNRARLGVTGNIPYDFSYYLMTELSPKLGGPYLLDGFVTYNRFAPYLKISFGQFKQAFGLELSQSCNDLYTVDRARVVNELASPFRDFGVMLLGGTGTHQLFGLENENLIEYRLSLTNGSGLNKMDDNLDKDFTARLILNPIKGLALGGSFRQGKQASVSAGEPDDSKLRMGADFSIDVKKLKIQGEYIRGVDKGSSIVGGGCGSVGTVQKGDFTKLGAWGSLMYSFDNGFAPIIKYQYYETNAKFASGAKDAQYNAELVLGINYYVNEWTRLQANYVITRDNKLDAANGFKKDFFVIQVQAKFD